jgi:hypothetical protein
MDIKLDLKTVPGIGQGRKVDESAVQLGSGQRLISQCVVKARKFWLRCCKLRRRISGSTVIN